MNLSRLFVLALALVLLAPTGARALSLPAPDPVVSIEQDLSLGSRGQAVTTLQEHLIARKSGPAAEALARVGATGTFGPLTRAAVAELQAKNGIAPAYGYFGARTRALLSVRGGPVATPTFSGTIEAVDTGCFADGICSVTIDGKKVILVAGFRMSPPPVGSLKGVASIGDLEAKIGSTARVFAARATEEGYDYTLYGSPSYYVDVVSSPAATPRNGSLTMRGTVGCLPPKNTDGPVIAMCAFGLDAEDGNHYALSARAGENLSVYDMGEVVEVRGTFRAGEDSTWASIGTIKVRSIRSVE